ncbi:MAG: DUF4915 domain-containing protein [Cytophagia bacterium]|nr:DUF4915 domain-containing protein [Cytophagia bacterium]
MIPKDKAILILGSVNANPDDRKLKRTDISSIQFMDDKLQVHHTNLLSSWGEFGISSLVFLPGSNRNFFITTGRSIFYIDTENQSFEQLKIERLRGIHEMNIIDQKLWISNTFYDEVLEYDYINKKTLNRHQLIPRQKIEPTEARLERDGFERINKFHCNQIFESFDKEIALLVHHTNGVQPVKVLAQKLIKSQGNGGIIYLRSNETIKLKLKAPHSIRLIKDQYWVFNSGHGELTIFNKDWSPSGTIKVNGWGRGADFITDTNILFAGLSAPRSRYFKFLDDAEKKNRILAIDAGKRKIRKEWVLSKLEQVNNLYLLDRELIELLNEMNPILEEQNVQ